jgi:hypothetical protein
MRKAKNRLPNKTNKTKLREKAVKLKNCSP